MGAVRVSQAWTNKTRGVGDVRSGADNGLGSDIAPCPKCVESRCGAVALGPYGHSCLAANISTHRSVRHMSLGAIRMSHCRKRATPSANAIIYGCGWHRSRLTDWERVSPSQSPRLQRFNSIDPNADSIMVAFPTETFLDAA